MNYHHHHHHPHYPYHYKSQPSKRSHSHSTNNDHDHSSLQTTLFQQQVEEFNQERMTLFGKDPMRGSYLEQVDHPPFQSMTKLQQQYQQQQQSHQNSSDSQDAMDDANKENGVILSQEQVDDWHQEREALFQFTTEEKSAWSQLGNDTTQVLSPNFMALIEQARQEYHDNQDEVRKQLSKPQTTKTTDSQQHISSLSSSSSSSSLTHVTKDGMSVHMVNVGSKAVTQRMAHAQTKVLFPPEVIQILSASSSDELMGPKGPILATAKLAGIMAAKYVYIYIYIYPSSFVCIFTDDFHRILLS